MKCKLVILSVVLLHLCSVAAQGTSFMTNVYGRDYKLLNGKWNVIVDQYDQGQRMEIYKNRKALKNEEFYEYSFEGGLRLNVPGDWNSQLPELKYYEGTVWYARHIECPKSVGKRLFLYFGAVSYRCNVYLNGAMVASHEGGFTPFQVEVTDLLKDGDNFLVVEVNNKRTTDAIPAMAFDWWNYGGITRDVMLVTTPAVYIGDYFVQLDKREDDLIRARVKLSEKVSEKVRIDIPELNVTKVVDAVDGMAEWSFKVKKLQHWAPGSPKLYDVSITCGEDKVSESIGFRNIEVDGTKILVNGVPTFMKCVSFHEEIPQRRGRAFSEADAVMLISEAKALGVNMIRLAHYPQNEYTVRLAEREGIILWQEIPVWQAIDFSDKATQVKACNMLTDMIERDKNRCAVGLWGIANETRPSEPREKFLQMLLDCGRQRDTTRLFVAAFDNVHYDPQAGAFTTDDKFMCRLDVVAVNKYMGWYAPWPVDPSQAHWKVAVDQPLIISEFGGEALYGQSGNENAAHSWSEDYQAKLYEDNLEMFRHIPNLAGVSPWILFDFRSPYRFHPTNQDGWNRKGLVSDQGYRKKAWYLMKEYYSNLK